MRLTHLDGNCALISDLSFCDSVAYSVPANPTKFNITELATFYDNYARTQFEFFERVLNMTPCETTASAQYSLARTCANCTAAYKQWLCAVAIPRCTDFSGPPDPWLRDRSMGLPFPVNQTFLPLETLQRVNHTAYLNSSRNPFIDANITSGPYKEILPCEDLCYHVVQSCPASMGFDCPLPGSIAFNQSYGQINGVFGTKNGEPTPVQCNYPGPTLFSVGSLALPSEVLMIIMFGLMGLMLI